MRPSAFLALITTLLALLWLFPCNPRRDIVIAPTPIPKTDFILRDVVFDVEAKDLPARAVTPASGRYPLPFPIKGSESFKQLVVRVLRELYLKTPTRYYEAITYLQQAVQVPEERLCVNARLPNGNCAEGVSSGYFAVEDTDSSYPTFRNTFLHEVGHNVPDAPETPPGLDRRNASEGRAELYRIQVLREMGYSKCILSFEFLPDGRTKTTYVGGCMEKSY